MQRNALGITMTGLVLAVALGTAPSPANAAEHEDMPATIQAAKSAADHEALAAAWDREAAQAKEMAAEHRKMGAAYKGRPVTSAGKGAGISTMPEHCEALAKSFDEQAKRYEDLANAERELAKSAK